MSVTQRREWGVLVERAVAERLNVAHVPDEEAEAYDVRVQEDTLLVDDVDGSIGVLKAGDVGEVKAAARRVCRASTPRHGRVHITRANHLELLERGGFYAVAIYDPQGADVQLDIASVQEDVVDDLVVVPAETVDVLVESWRPSGHGYDYTQLAWTSIVDAVQDAVSESNSEPATSATQEVEP